MLLITLFKPNTISTPDKKTNAEKVLGDKISKNIPQKGIIGKNYTLKYDDVFTIRKYLPQYPRT